MADLCIHEVARCTICHPSLTPNDREPDSRPFTARYDGTCNGCGFDIRPGDIVRFAHAGRLHHQECAHG